MSRPLQSADASDLDDDIDYDPAAHDGGVIPELLARLAALRAAKGVVRLRFGSDTHVALLRYADVEKALRDETRFSKSEAFRPVTFPFMGPICLGAFLARAELAVALEVLLRRLPNLRLVEQPRIAGVVLRGPRKLRVEWDAP